MKQQALIIGHSETAEGGRIPPLLREFGLQSRTLKPIFGDALPEDLSGVACAVVLGGPMSVNDDEPYLRAEEAWIRKVVEAGIPFLGICLGAQLLSKAFGGTVAPRPDGVTEIGYYPVSPTAAAGDLFDGLDHVYHWHKEGFSLPEGAELLLTGETGFPHQAFRLGPHAYGLQFHPEVTPEIMDRWHQGAPEMTELPGAKSITQHLEDRAIFDPIVHAWTAKFLCRELWQDCVYFS